MTGTIHPAARSAKARSARQCGVPVSITVLCAVLVAVGWSMQRGATRRQEA